MKKTMCVLALAMVMLSCGDKKKTDSGTTTSDTSGLSNNSSDKTASFTADGTSYSGRVSTQHFGGESGNFSVLCQQDEPFALLQAVFANEKEAKATATYPPAGSSYNVAAGLVSVALSGTAIGDLEYITTSKSTGTIKVEDDKLILTDLKLFNRDNKEKVVTATIAW